MMSMEPMAEMDPLMAWMMVPWREVNGVEMERMSTWSMASMTSGS